MTFEDILIEREAAARDERKREIIGNMLRKLAAEEVAKLTHLPLDRILQVQRSMGLQSTVPAQQ